jgi:hypothetical protein
VSRAKLRSYCISPRLSRKIKSVAMLTRNGYSFVCAVQAMDLAASTGPVIFRTYSVPRNETYDCKIWEAARATSAAPTYFPRIEIGPANRKQKFIDAGIGCNNPTNELIQECELLHGRSAKIACIVSIGTGKPDVIRYENPGWFQRYFPTALGKSLASLASDTERVAEALEKRFANEAQSLYWRLNVNRGLSSVSLEEWKRLGEVEGYTETFLKYQDVSDKIDKLVAVLIWASGQMPRAVGSSVFSPEPAMISAFSGTGYRLGD